MSDSIFVTVQTLNSPDINVNIDNDGRDGREIEIQKTNTHIQWRYAGEPTWTNLIALSELKGDPGPGTDLTYDAVTRELRSSTGADATLPLVSTTTAGLMAPANLTKLDSAVQPAGLDAGLAGKADIDHRHQRDTTLLVVNLSGSQSDPVAANTIERFTFQWPAQILGSALSGETPAAGAAFEVNARLNASSIYSVRPQIAIGNTSGTSGTLAITTAAEGDILRFDISQAAGGCRNAQLYLTVRRTE
jgi:hypothetical protein